MNTMTTMVTVSHNALEWMTGDAHSPSIGCALGEYAAGRAGDFDMDEAEDDYRNRLNALLPDGASICGDELIADNIVPSVVSVLTREHERIRGDAVSIDLGDVLQCHDCSSDFRE